MPRTFSQQLVGTSGFPQRCSFAGAEGPTIIRVTGGFGFNPTIDGEDFPGLDEDQAIAELGRDMRDSSQSTRTEPRWRKRERD